MVKRPSIIAVRVESDVQEHYHSLSLVMDESTDRVAS